MKILNEMGKIKNKMKNYNFMLGEITHFKLLNPANYIKKSTHKGTDYYYFECEVISKDRQLIPIGKHTIQLPSKRVVFPMISKINELGKINQKISVTITKKSNCSFDICIHS